MAIGTADLYGLYLTVKHTIHRPSRHQIPLAFFISEIVRLFIVFTLLLVLSFQTSISFGWLVAGPLLFTPVKYVYAFRKLRRS
jgi:hypothetical protein